MRPVATGPQEITLRTALAGPPAHSLQSAAGCRTALSAGYLVMSRSAVRFCSRAPSVVVPANKGTRLHDSAAECRMSATTLRVGVAAAGTGFEPVELSAGGGGEEPPRLIHALHQVFAAIIEGDPGPGDEIRHCPRHQHLSRTCQCPHSGSDVDGEPGDVIATAFTLPRMQTDPNIKAGLLHRPHDRAAAVDRMGRATEAGEELVAGRLDSCSPKRNSGSASSTSRSWSSSRGVPLGVTQRHGGLGRSHDVGEQHRRQKTLATHWPAFTGDELSHLTKDGAWLPANRY